MAILLGVFRLYMCEEGWEARRGWKKREEERTEALAKARDAKNADFLMVDIRGKPMPP